MAVYSYSDEFDPPAPVVSINISSAAIASTTGTSSVITVMVDTGSDITVVPALVIQDLAVDISFVGRVTGVGGPSPASTLYTVLVSLEKEGPVLLNALAWEEDFALLDRDAIKDWKLLLDGPNGALTIYR